MKFNPAFQTIWALLFTFSLTNTVLAQPELYLAGKDYQLIQTTGKAPTPGTITVEEFFWYGCPGCFQLDPQLEAWKHTVPENVVFSRFPAIWDDLREVHGKAYYTALELGLLDNLHSKLFNAMHLERKRFKNEAELQDFFVSQGVSPQTFSRTYRSFTVSTAINRAKQKAGLYAAQSTPSIIVNGKYLVPLGNNILAIVDFLIQKEQRLYR